MTVLMSSVLSYVSSLIYRCHPCFVFFFLISSYLFYFLDYRQLKNGNPNRKISTTRNHLIDFSHEGRAAQSHRVQCANARKGLNGDVIQFSFGTKQINTTYSIYIYNVT